MKTGLESLLDNPSAFARGRCALVANPTTVDRALVHGADRLHAHDAVDLALLLGPEHGIRSDAQYMVGVGDERDAATGLPVVSLYGETFESLSPKPDVLAPIDTLFFDIQDVGTRYYTYAATLALCMKVAAETTTRVVVLDRPNPLGGVAVEGSGLEPGLESFVGLYPVPQRHGLTVGELALVYNSHFAINCELEVVRCEGWERQQYYDETDLPWVLPSPNMPTLDTAIVYPGMCLLEGTTMSEGRGTTRPFEFFGAPYVDGAALKEELESYGIEGALLRPASFVPTFDKYRGTTCRGLQVHVTDREAFRSYRFGLALITAMHRLYPEDFGWRTEPYEFRDDVLAFDLLTGVVEVREAIERDEPFDVIWNKASQLHPGYSSWRKSCLLYGGT